MPNLFIPFKEQDTPLDRAHNSLASCRQDPSVPTLSLPRSSTSAMVSKAARKHLETSGACPISHKISITSVCRKFDESFCEAGWQVWYSIQPEHIEKEIVRKRRKAWRKEAGDMALLLLPSSWVL